MALRSDRPHPPPAGAPGHDDGEGVRDGLDAVLARVPISAERWAEALPPAPAGTAVTVSFSNSSARTEHGEALELLGYRVLNAPSPPLREQAAWVLVRRDTIEGRATWWDSIQGHADRVYDLRFGPALRLLEPILRAHLAQASRK